MNALLAGDDIYRRKLLEKYKRIDDQELRAELQQLEPLESDTAERFKEWGVKPLSAEQMAAKADLTPLYLSTYPVLSDTVHAGIRDLERHVQTDGKQIVALHNGPKLDDLEILFVMATEFLIVALDAFTSLLELDTGDFCDMSKRKLHELHADHRGKCSAC